MICPILKSGTMIKSYERSFSVGPGMGGTRHNDLQHESAECMGKECEWFKQGCPAHPITDALRDKIRAMK